MRASFLLYIICAYLIWTLCAHAETLPANTVLARVNGIEITEAQYQTLLADLPKQISSLPDNVIRKVALDQLINTEVVLQAAAAAKIEADPAVQRHLQAARERVLVESYLKKTGDAKLTDADLKKPYAQFKKDNPSVETVKTRQIMVKDEKTAQAVIEKLNDGADFTDLAKEYNIKAQDKANAGAMNYVAKNEAPPAYTEAAFALKKGEYTKTPVKTSFGWSVIKLEDRRERPTPKFDDVKETLRGPELQRVMQKELASLREKAKVDVLYNPPAEDKK